MRRRSTATSTAITSAAHYAVEGLESRTLLSVSIKQVTDAGLPGLKITGNGSKDTVLIVDDQITGMIDVTANGKTTHYTGIVSFHVDMGGGNDKLEYDLLTIGGPTEARSLHLDGDAGDDRVSFTSVYDEEAAETTTPPAATGLAEFSVELFGDDGNDMVFADVNYLSDVNVTFDVRGGSGIDSVGVSLGSLSVGAGATDAPSLLLNVDLGSGRNALNIEVGEQSVGSTVDINVKGGNSTGSSFDKVNIDVGPSITGAVLLDVNLGSGDDTLNVDGEIATGGGQATTTAFNLSGGDGKDKMALTLDGVYGDGFSFTNLQLKGGNGDDTLTADLSNIFVAEGGELIVNVDGQNNADTINGSFAFTVDVSASTLQSLQAAAVTGVLTPGTVDISLLGGQHGDRFNVFAATEEEVLDSGGPILVNGQGSTDKIKYLAGADKTLFTVQSVEQVVK